MLITREAAAYHEAGHAVVALLTGANVERVTILARKRRINGKVVQTRGITQSYLPFDISESLRRKKDAVITLAGPLAEECYLGTRQVPEDIIRSEEDYVLRLAREARGPGNRLLDWYGDRRDEASRLIVKHWPLIGSVARALIDCGSLTGSEVRSIACAAGWHDPHSLEAWRRRLRRRWRERERA